MVTFFVRAIHTYLSQEHISFHEKDGSDSFHFLVYFLSNFGTFYVYAGWWWKCAKIAECVAFYGKLEIVRLIRFVCMFSTREFHLRAFLLRKSERLVGSGTNFGWVCILLLQETWACVFEERYPGHVWNSLVVFIYVFVSWKNVH